MKDYILRIRYELEKAELPEDIIKEVHTILTHERLAFINFQKLESERDNLKEKIDRLRIKILHNGRILIDEFDEILGEKN